MVSIAESIYPVQRLKNKCLLAFRNVTWDNEVKLYSFLQSWPVVVAAAETQTCCIMYLFSVILVLYGKLE